MPYSYIRTDTVLLEIKGVSMSYGDKLILRDVNATVTDIHRDSVEQGQVICFLGPSGIGKTQLSRIIAGLQKPTAGTVSLQGKPTAPGAVSMVPQHYPMFEYMTVAQNLRAAGKQVRPTLTDAKINEKATAFITTFGLGEHLGKYPRELSGGTKQRVAIARQMMCADRYMVMDEPFSGLDPIMKAKTTDAITKLAQIHSHNTVIIVTHDVTEGLTVSDTVWMMGYEKGEDGSNVPGARLVETFDLAEMGFAWRPDLDHDPKFLEFVRHVKDRFKTLR
jgi:ABC-type nitrate/sulfonate/bicarbonate transport system ATPase subunit